MSSKIKQLFRPAEDLTSFEGLLTIPLIGKYLYLIKTLLFAKQSKQQYKDLLNRPAEVNKLNVEFSTKFNQISEELDKIEASDVKVRRLAISSKNISIFRKALELHPTITADIVGEDTEKDKLIYILTIDEAII